MGRRKNRALAGWMEHHQVTAAELAELVSESMEQLTGGRGNVSERTVFRWLSTENRWPQDRQRLALENVTGLPATRLGFVPRGRATAPAPAPREDPLLRRTFLTAATGNVLAATTPNTIAASPTTGARPTVGLVDVQRLRHRLTELWERDDKDGGTLGLEELASAEVRHILRLQQNGNATGRIRSRLYTLAAAFSATAMWAVVDCGRLGDAQRYLEQSVTLAGLSGDGEVQHQTWRNAAVLASQRGRHADALAAAEAAMATRAHRADSLYASLSHARIALAASSGGDSPRALRALERAATAFGRADLDIPRSPSVSFYTEGELHGLMGIAHYRLGRAGEAEYHAYQCLAALRPDQHRNRAYYTAQAALAQLSQGDVEQACDTAAAVMPPPGTATTARVPRLLGTFTSALQMKAPGSTIAREWQERATDHHGGTRRPPSVRETS
ncbi:Tat pathway signal protein [Streptomyces sp. NPDC008313]|uniref:Tat pathway signal protein n=1 Tax=Streptomyces sp. NPDC008313 TaxID=3364826 RepID=UPI0036E5946E